MGLKWTFFEINGAPSQTCWKYRRSFVVLPTLNLVVPGNLFQFFNLKLEYFLEFFTFLTFAYNFHLSAGNLGLFEENGIYVVRSIVNSQKLNSKMLLLITVIEFSEFRSQRHENLHREIKNKSYHHRRIFRPVLEDGDVNKVFFEMIFKCNESLCLVLKPLKHKQKRVPLCCFRCISLQHLSQILL